MSEELSITRVIKFAIATEEAGAHAYSELARRFADQEEISAVLSTLAKDEKAHQAQFEALLDSAPGGEGIASDSEGSLFLRAMATSEFFIGDTGLVTKLAQAESLDEALVQALAFEKAALGFYLAAKDLLGEAETLDRVIQAEKSHVARLMRYILTDEKMKGLADPF